MAPRFNSQANYRNTYDQINSITSGARNTEKVNEANRGISDLRSEILKLEIMVKAMFQVMVEQGVDPNLINEKIDKIMADPKTFMPSEKDSMPCPKCGRLVLDNGTTPLTGTCLYCGTVVKFTPHISADDFAEDQENGGDGQPAGDGFSGDGLSGDGFSGDGLSGGNFSGDNGFPGGDGFTDSSFPG